MTIKKAVLPLWHKKSLKKLLALRLLKVRKSLSVDAMISKNQYLNRRTKIGKHSCKPLYCKIKNLIHILN